MTVTAAVGAAGAALGRPGGAGQHGLRRPARASGQARRCGCRCPVTCSATATAGSGGGFARKAVLVPAAYDFGLTAITAAGAASGRSATAPLYVTGPWSQAGHDPERTATSPIDRVLSEEVTPGKQYRMQPYWVYSAARADRQLASGRQPAGIRRRHLGHADRGAHPDRSAGVDGLAGRRRRLLTRGGSRGRAGRGRIVERQGQRLRRARPASASWTVTTGGPVDVLAVDLPRRRVRRSRRPQGCTRSRSRPARSLDRDACQARSTDRPRSTRPPPRSSSATAAGRSPRSTSAAPRRPGAGTSPWAARSTTAP